MFWVIWDILVPLGLAFFAGLFFGWLFWRWRRMQITSDELAAMRRSNARYKSDADTLRNRNAELAERLRASTGASDSTTLQELAAANKRTDKLREQLKMANRELARKQQSSNQGKDFDNRSGATQLRSAKSDLVRDLEARLSAAHQQIKILETSATIPQIKHGTLAERSDSGLQQTTSDEYLVEEIAVRDKMIATLRHSLEQYGEQQDNTALLAEIALREQRIIALENLLNDAQRVA